jgi:CBS domain-containing protein
VVTLNAEQALHQVQAWIALGAPGSSHQGFPVVDGNGHLAGVVTRRQLLDPNASPQSNIRDLIKQVPVVVYSDSTLRDAADQMATHNIGRLPVIDRKHPVKPIGFITRSDLLTAHRKRLEIQ